MSLILYSKQINRTVNFLEYHTIKMYSYGDYTIYQCPNFGRTYTEFENVYYCGFCNYKLQKQEDIKN